MATLQNLGVLKYRDKDGNWKPLPVVLQNSSGGDSGGISTISGNGQPTESTVGRLNQLYRDESTDKLYICTGVEGGYTWAAVVSDTEDAVTYTAQTLTEEQKTQARANIGAGTSNFSGSYNDLNDQPNIPAATVIDTTLSKSGNAADAKAAGDAIGKKIDAPQTAQVGEVLTVEEVDAEGKPKKWKTAAVDPKSIKDMYYEGFDAIDTWIHDPDNQHISENNITLSAGEQCTVRIGDDEYKVVAENKQTGRYDYSMVLGTWDFSSVPFYFTIASEYGAEVAFGKLYTRLSDSVTAGTKISLEKNFAHTIKEKYFPKTIFTQENAPVRFGDILKNSAVQGKETVASGQSSHAEGYQTTASGDNSHAEGRGTMASGSAAHAEGSNTVASNIYSHAEGIDTKATGTYSHAEGESTIASGIDQHVQGRRNIKDENDKYAHIVGNGNSTKASNAHTLDWEGNAWFAGNVYVGSTSGTNKDDGSVRLATINDLSKCFRVNLVPTKNDDGTVTYVSDVPALFMYDIMFERIGSPGNSIECYLNLNGDSIIVLNFIESHMTILKDGNTALSFKFSSYVSGKHISAEIKDTIRTNDKEILSTVVTVTESASLPAPTTAQVGQIVKVKAVDADGKITETETVDMPTQKHLKWITVHSSDLTEEKTEIVISTDSNGKTIASYNPIGLTLVLSTPADSTQKDNNGTPWIYPSATYQDNAIRVIGSISGWKTTARDNVFTFIGGSSAMSCVGNVNTQIATYKIDGYSLDGVKAFLNGTSNHFPIGTHIEVSILCESN